MCVSKLNADQNENKDENWNWMNDINSIFFELIRVAIGAQRSLSRMPNAKEWKQIYDIAKKQSIIGICFAGLQRLGADMDDGFAKIGMSEMLYLKWMGMAAKIQQKNEVVNQQCVALQKRIYADGFRSYIMKGQAVGTFYRVYENEDINGNFHQYDSINHKPSTMNLSLLRQSGDIDVYLDGGLETVLAYAKTFGEVEHVNELEMTVPVFRDTEVEFHYRPFIMRNPFKNKRLQAFFDTCSEANFANKVCLNENEDCWIVASTTEFNLVHQLAHIHLHLFTEGIGMRQLMDYYFVLKARKDENHNEDGNENVLRIVHELGLDGFASALMWVMGYVFGLQREQMLWKPNEKDGHFLLDEIMRSGNFGKHDEKLQTRKSKTGYGLWALLIRNLRLSRFDRGDWFWGPQWRVYYWIWKRCKGYM